MRGADRREAENLRAVAVVLPWLGGDEDRRRRKIVRGTLLFASCLHLALLPLPLFSGRTAPERMLDLRPEPYRLAPTPAPRPPEPEPPSPETAEPVAAPVRVPVPQPPSPEPVTRPLAIPPAILPMVEPPGAALEIPSSPPQPSDRVVDWNPEIERPVRIAGPDPVYTECARGIRLEGIVVLEAIVDRDGAVRDPRVLRGLPCRLDESAVRAVSAWTFRPATRGDAPLSVRYRLTVRFTLR